MDKQGQQQPRKWEWLPQQMPGAAALIREKRRLYGDAHVNRCWAEGVTKCQPGWFFAREGALWVGTPPMEPDFASLVATRFTATQATLFIREPEVTDGAH